MNQVSGSSGHVQSYSSSKCFAEEAGNLENGQGSQLESNYAQVWRI